jgi:hypothetical protein
MRSSEDQNQNRGLIIWDACSAGRDIWGKPKPFLRVSRPHSVIFQFVAAKSGNLLSGIIPWIETDLWFCDLIEFGSQLAATAEEIPQIARESPGFDLITFVVDPRLAS